MRRFFCLVVLGWILGCSGVVELGQTASMDLFGMWRDKAWEFETNLSVDAAAARLRDGLHGRKRTWSDYRFGGASESDYLMVGEVVGSHIQVGAARSSNTNSWRSIYSANLEPTSSGSSLRGTVGYRRFLKVFCGLWLFFPGAVALCSAVIGIVLLLVGSEGDGQSLLAVAGFAAGVFAFGGLIMAVANGVGRTDEAHLRKWIEQRLSESP